MIPTALAPATESSPARSPWPSWGWPLAMGAASRLLILVAMALLAPALPLPPAGHPFVVDWSLFARWDSGWYETIARSGYEFSHDGHQHNVAFYPLFPLLIRGLMEVGLPFHVAGTLVANLSFLGALVLFHRWVLERHGAGTARWTTALLAWSPYSLFGSMIYTEGLFLLLSGATLAAFDRRQYGRAALFGALASATRIQGILLAPALLWGAWRERRELRGYAAALVTGTGLALYAAFCWARFADPLAFIKAQAGWHSGLGLNVPEWLNLLTFGMTGPAPENGVIKAFMLLGGTALLVIWHRRLGAPMAAYGGLSIALILASGNFASPDRYVYGALPVALALGLTLTRRKGWGIALVGICAILLVLYSFKMAWGVWVA